jgi:hypothetical protein
MKILEICGVEYGATVNRYGHFILLEKREEVWESNISLDKLGYANLSDIPAFALRDIIASLYAEMTITGCLSLNHFHPPKMIAEINRAYKKGQGISK